MQAILEAHDAHADWTMLQVRVTRFSNGVVIDIYNIIQHAHSSTNCFLELLVIQNHFTGSIVSHVRRQVHRAQVTNSNFALVGVQSNLSTQVGRVNYSNVLLRTTNIARIFKCDPWVTSFKQHTQHLAP